MQIIRGLSCFDGRGCAAALLTSRTRGAQRLLDLIFSEQGRLPRSASTWGNWCDFVSVGAAAQYQLVLRHGTTMPQYSGGEMCMRI
jgi:hypothetical protein